MMQAGVQYNEAHSSGTNAAHWFGQFLEDNKITSISELLYEIDFNELAGIQ